jgi:hypothetical protein
MRVLEVGLIVLAAVCAGANVSASTKTGRTYYTEERLAAMRENVEKYDWAKRTRDATIAAADGWLAYPDEELRIMVPPPELARAQYVHETGCPEHGLAIRKFGTYAWKISLEHPFKVQCPVGGEFYPDNDFEAYYRSCFAGGRYDPDKGDRSLLKGKIVDEGWGWHKPDDPNPQKYWFVAYYVHWMLARKVVPGVLRDCSQAYLLTAEERYAHKAALVLWQLAEYYPEYAYEKQSRRGTELDPHYWGKLVYHTWETGTVDVAALAYDAVFPYLDEDGELQQMTGQSGAEIKEHIESRMLREMARLIIDGSHTIQGNYGSHQRSLLKVALACGDEEHEPRRSEMVDWVLNNDEVGGYTDLSLRDALYNIVFRDGVPFESPGYNTGWVGNLLAVAEMLDVCGVDVFSWPRLKRLCDWPIDMTCCGQFTPALGDSGNMYHGLVGRSGGIYGPAYRHWRDPRYAKLHAEIPGVPSHDLFSECLDEEMARVAEEYEAELGTESLLFPAYGMAILQSGDETNRTALMLHYIRHIGHAHFDGLHLDLYSRGNALIPDFGYPETCNSQDPRRFGFFTHTLAHNTVMVNETRGANAIGALLAYQPSGFCKVVEVHSEGVYRDTTSVYRRTLALIEATPSDAYVVDIFRVSGGEQHDWIVHGTDASMESNLALTEPRTEGTLAGAEVAYGHFYDNEEMAKAPYGSISYAPYTGSGFMFLYNVQEAALEGYATASWRLGRSAERAPDRIAEGIVLRAHLLGDGERVYVCEGKPQQNTKATPESVKFLLRRRKGESLESTYVTVFEPYEGGPFLGSASRLRTTPDDPGVVALRIEKMTGATDYFVSALDPSVAYQVEGGMVFQGETGALSVDADGEVMRAQLSNGTLLKMGGFSLSCDPPRTVPIESVDYEAGAINLAEPALRDRALEGRWVIISNEAHATAYRVERILSTSSFSIGDQDPRCGRLTPTGYAPDAGELATSNLSYFVEAGMRLADEAGNMLGRITGTGGRAVRIEGEPIEPEQLPDADGDGRGRAWVMDFGEGDQVKIPSSAAYVRAGR